MFKRAAVIHIIKVFYINCGIKEWFAGVYIEC